MRVTPLLSSILVVALSGTAFAQEWDEFLSKEERFTCNFPGTPTITETTWTSQFGAILPARIYSGTQGSGKYYLKSWSFRRAQSKISTAEWVEKGGGNSVQY